MKPEITKNTTDKEDKIIDKLRWELKLVKDQRDRLLKFVAKLKKLINEY